LTTLSPGTRFGPYDVLAANGAGGMGEVYRGRDPRLNREVALKVLPDAFAGDRDRLQRFAREALTLAALSHPNIAQLHAIEEVGDVRALASVVASGRFAGTTPVGGFDVTPDGSRLLVILGAPPPPSDAAQPAALQLIVHADLSGGARQ
jgi:hypothetical protein